MSRMTRMRSKGRRDKGPFLALPHAVLDSPNYLSLSVHARSLLVDLSRQYNGNNNGDLCAAWKLMEPRGLKSRDTLWKALKELRHYGLIELTRQGGLNRPSLYAVTWLAVDDCGGKLDVAPTRVASGLWRQSVPVLTETEPKCAGKKWPARQACQPDTADGSVTRGDSCWLTRWACGVG